MDAVGISKRDSSFDEFARQQYYRICYIFGKSGGTFLSVSQFMKNFTQLGTPRALPQLHLRPALEQSNTFPF